MTEGNGMDAVEAPTPEDRKRLDAAMYGALKRVAVDGQVLEVLEGEVATAMCGMVLQLMTEQLQLKLGLTAEHAHAASVGWIVGRASAAEEASR